MTALVVGLSQECAAGLSVVPSEVLNLAFDPNEFTTLLRFWTGMPVDTDSCLCPWCKTIRQDAFGYHALVCKSTGLKILRHNALKLLSVSACVSLEHSTGKRNAGNKSRDCLNMSSRFSVYLFFFS